MDALKNISNLPLYLKMPVLRLVDSRYSDSIKFTLISFLRVVKDHFLNEGGIVFAEQDQNSYSFIKSNRKARPAHPMNVSKSMNKNLYVFFFVWMNINKKNAIHLQSRCKHQSIA